MWSGRRLQWRRTSPSRHSCCRSYHDGDEAVDDHRPGVHDRAPNGDGGEASEQAVADVGTIWGCHCPDPVKIRHRQNESHTSPSIGLSLK
ncbi:hypothetical protein TIFTF001_024853 [Ficus carica]|uniref:Uncharacterized protein n=1 Tax=Ficus carica TaxID=3494 RepID=A0AA88DKG1_FICCA|nr:hypothetical protein TIFTF001_024853 [Ficus carica]